MPASASAFCWASAPASVTGAIAPASVNGVITTGWLRDAISMMPCNIGVSRRSGELELMTVKIDGSRSRVASSTPAGDAHHLDAVDVLLAAEAVAVDVLVGERQHVERGVEVTNRGVHVDRLDRVAGRRSGRVEHLAEPEQIVEVVAVAGPAHAVEIADVGGLATPCRRPYQSPPMGRFCSGFQVCSVNSAGAVVIRSTIIAGSNRTCGPSSSTSAPASASRAARLRVPDVHADLARGSATTRRG